MQGNAETSCSVQPLLLGGHSLAQLEVGVAGAVDYACVALPRDDVVVVLPRGAGVPPARVERVGLVRDGVTARPIAITEGSNHWWREAGGRGECRQEKDGVQLSR